MPWYRDYAQPLQHLYKDEPELLRLHLEGEGRRILKIVWMALYDRAQSRVIQWRHV